MEQARQSIGYEPDYEPRPMGSLGGRMMNVEVEPDYEPRPMGELDDKIMTAEADALSEHSQDEDEGYDVESEDDDDMTVIECKAWDQEVHDWPLTKEQKKRRSLRLAELEIRSLRAEKRQEYAFEKSRRIAAEAAVRMASKKAEEQRKGDLRTTAALREYLKKLIDDQPELTDDVREACEKLLSSALKGQGHSLESEADASSSSSDPVQKQEEATKQRTVASEAVAGEEPADAHAAASEAASQAAADSEVAADGRADTHSISLTALFLDITEPLAPLAKEAAAAAAASAAALAAAAANKAAPALPPQLDGEPKPAQSAGLGESVQGAIRGMFLAAWGEQNEEPASAELAASLKGCP